MEKQKGVELTHNQACLAITALHHALYYLKFVEDEEVRVNRPSFIRSVEELQSWLKEQVNA